MRIGFRRLDMRTTWYLILAGFALICVGAGQRVLGAPPTTIPPVSPPSKVQNVGPDLQGVPDNIKTLILGFDQTRDKFLAQQSVLLAKLKGATTDADRDKIREQLQQNRQAFLDSLKDFRNQLKDQITALKGKISHTEFLRIVDATHDAATEGGPKHHRGN